VPGASHVCGCMPGAGHVWLARMPGIRTHARCKPYMVAWNTRCCNNRQVGESLYADMVIKGLHEENDF